MPPPRTDAADPLLLGAVPARPVAGLYLVHKPRGFTSHTLVRAWAPRAEAFGLRLCHAGTLDPFAEGLVVLLLGPATRLMDLLHEAPKSYRASVRWGVETDTGDPDGRPLPAPSGRRPAIPALEAALPAFLGWRDQVPPATSARKVGGEPAYRRVHRGEDVVLPAAPAYLHAAAWQDHQLPHRSTLSLTCRGGFYVRALARDLGRALGCGAHLDALVRTGHGPWRDPGPGVAVHVVGAAATPWLPSASLDAASLAKLRRDGRLPELSLDVPPWPFPAGFPAPTDRAVACLDGRAVAILRRDAQGWASEIDLRRGI